jgi:hypothetical protein
MEIFDKHFNLISAILIQAWHSEVRKIFFLIKSYVQTVIVNKAQVVGASRRDIGLPVI